MLATIAVSSDLITILVIAVLILAAFWLIRHL